MKLASTIASVFVLCATAHAGGGAEWSYSRSTAPEHWAGLSPDYVDCAGKNQSPVDLKGFIEADLPPIEFNYQVGGAEIINNGHTIQVNYAPGSSIELDGHSFELKQFHFHAPSENWIEGESYPMEAHLVHADPDGNLAVVAVLFSEGEANAEIDAAWAEMPDTTGEKRALASSRSADGILPADRDYYRFNGSLTTPPCTEGVRWLVMKAQMSVSKQQIEHFSHMMHDPNNRPLQAVNARPLLK